MANLMDRNNAMVQVHLADHYFWNWELVSGAKIAIKKGEKSMESSMVLNLDPGERIRIGSEFETVVAIGGGGGEGEGEEEYGMGGRTVIPLRDAWPYESAGEL